MALVSSTSSSSAPSSTSLSVIPSLAILRTEDPAGAQCLAVAVASDVLLTPSPCVATWRAAQWTAQFVSSNDVDADRLVVDHEVEVASIDSVALSHTTKKAARDHGVAVVRLQPAPAGSTTLTVANNSVMNAQDNLIVVRVDLATLEYTIIHNVTRLASERCGSAIGSSSVVCVDTVDDGRATILIAEDRTPLGFGSSAQLSNNASAFVLLPAHMDLSSAPASSASSDGVEMEEPGVPEGTMDTYVLTPDKAPLTQAPSFMVGLRLTKNGASYCGGSLIAPSVVLTAAHCLDSGAVPAFVAIGAIFSAGNDDDPQAEQLAVDRVLLHPQFNGSTKANDLALVVLREPSRSHSPVRLENARRLRADRATVYGYGVTQQDAAELSSVLSSVELPLIASREQCETRFGARIDASFLCAGGEAGRDACTGDSGGPLVVVSTTSTPSLLGVVSAGVGCGVQGRPGLYTWVGSASAVAFISMHVPDASWTESVRLNGVAVPVVVSRDDAFEYPQFVNVSEPGTGSGMESPAISSSTPTTQERGGSSPTNVPSQPNSSSNSSVGSSTMLYRVEFGGEDLTVFTRTRLLQFLASGSMNDANTAQDDDQTATQTHVRVTLLSSARLDSLVGVISRHDTLALHRRRVRW